MNRRQLMGTLGAGGVALFAAGTASAAQRDQGAHGEHFDMCAKACADCQIECQSCNHHCAQLLAEGQKQHLQTMKLCADCGDVCAAAANIVARHGALSAAICESCAKACDECGKACEKFPDDKHMKACAEECKKCAKACREMMKHVGAHHAEEK